MQIQIVSSLNRCHVGRLGKWSNSLAVQLPARVVEVLKLQEGDEIEIAGPRNFRAKRDQRCEAALAKLKTLN